MTDPKQYWEKKIIDWDALRNEGKLKSTSLAIKLIKNPPDIIKYRKQLILSHLQPHIRDKRVIEIGCGTGRMADPIIKLGAQSYHGIDFTNNGIRACIERTSQQGNSNRISFQCDDIGNIKELNGDFVFTNGVLAYLSDRTLDHLFYVTRGMNFFHLNNEPRLNLRQWFRRLFETVATNHIQSKFRKSGDVIKIANKHGWKNVYVLRNKQLHTTSAISSISF